jgi:benzoyl-CoA reductase subunit A
MKVFLGIDLGSTTTKAAVLDEQGGLLGRGLTNTRANFDAACAVASAEAMADARFARLPEAVRERAVLAYRRAGRRHRLARLRTRCDRAVAGDGTDHEPLRRALRRLFRALAPALDAAPPDAFFGDTVQNEASRQAEESSAGEGVPYEALLGLFERELVADEADGAVPAPEDLLESLLEGGSPDERAALERCFAEPFSLAARAGTGYGRHRLPFEKSEIRSEILCHGLGARHAFPRTRTVLDIGGQDTKAIQLDDQGLVTSFQMNDRCAAGCGRYLGYVAEELGLPLAELGPLAMCSGCPSKINSTCTVFAGAEIRERLALGEKREDVVAGLHRAIVLRAVGLLARSGGVSDELCFSGGVARNGAVVRLLREEIAAHYGPITVNVSADSILNGAIGAALFARAA